MKKTSSECAAVRESLSRGLPASDQQPHLFRCPACRMRVRISVAFKSLPRRKAFEPTESVDPIFVQRVVAAVRRDRQRRIRTRLSLAAAAALLFFFFLGASHHAASNSTAGAEDAYAQLTEPSGLDSLLPD